MPLHPSALGWGQAMHPDAMLACCYNFAAAPASTHS